MKTNTSSSKFIILFIVILLALAALITGVFFYSEYRLVHSGLFDQQCVPEFPIWSNISDLFNLILGVPTALAGSVVALFIAHRAYVISSRQSYYETLQYLEKIVSDSSLLFWNLASDLRRFEDSAQKLIVSVIAHSETEEIQLRSSGDKGFDQGVGTSHWGDHFSLCSDKISDENRLYIENIEKELRTRETEFVDSLCSLSSGILKLLQNPVSRRVWEEANQANESPVEIFRRCSNIEDTKGNGLSRFKYNYCSPSEDFYNGSLVGLAHSISRWAQDITRFSRYDNLRLELLKTRLPSYKWDDDNKVWLRNVAQKTRIDGAMKSSTKQVAMSTQEIYGRIRGDEFAISMRRHLQSADKNRKLSLYSSMISNMATGENSKTYGNNFCFNFGLLGIYAVLCRFPSNDDFVKCVRSTLQDQNIHEVSTIEAISRMAKDTGVGDYLSPWMKEIVAEGLGSEKECDLYCSVNPWDFKQ